MVNPALAEFGRQRKKLPVGQGGHSEMEWGHKSFSKDESGGSVACQGQVTPTESVRLHL